MLPYVVRLVPEEVQLLLLLRHLEAYGGRSTTRRVNSEFVMYCEKDNAEIGMIVCDATAI